MPDKYLSTQFDSELHQVSARVMELGGLVEEQIRQAIYALSQFSDEAVEQVYSLERRVNSMEVEIDHELTTIIARPDTQPAIDTPETLEFVTRRAAEASPVRIRHMAALTKHRDGREMTEIGCLLDAGAIAFTDVFRVATETKALSRALTYARSLGALVIGHPQEPGLSSRA